MERYTRCGNESAFYYEPEMTSETSVSFVSPLMAVIEVSLDLDDSERADPKREGAINITSDFLDLNAMTKTQAPEDKHDQWGNQLVDLVAKYGIDPVVLATEFESSFSEEDKDDILERIGLMLTMASFTKKMTEDKGKQIPEDIRKVFKSEDRTFVTEGSAAHKTFMMAKERVEKEGFEGLEKRWRKITARESLKPPMLQIFSPDEIKLRNDLRAYVRTQNMLVVPNAREAAAAYLNSIGAFECARMIP